MNAKRDDGEQKRHQDGETASDDADHRAPFRVIGPDALERAGKTVIEVSSKRLFEEKKSDLSKEAPILLDKVCDAIREGNLLPFAIQIREPRADLAKPRQDGVVKYLSEKLLIPESQITVLSPADDEKRGAVVAISANATPGGAGQ